MYKNIFKTIFLLVLILCLTSGLGISISAESQEESRTSAITQNAVDTDGDGLNDSFEEMLGTNKTNKYGDFDNDGLYDFEELLDIFTKKGDRMPNLEESFYKYNESKTHNETLDIYHALKIEEKDQFFRDITILGNPKENVNTLYWNVTVLDTEEGDEERTYHYSPNYINNHFLDVNLVGKFVMTSSLTTTFLRNSFVNVNFSGEHTGATFFGRLEYKDNLFSNVRFTGLYAGGSKTNSVYYYNNTIRDTVFQGRYSGGTGGLDSGYIDESAGTTYENNTIENVIFSGEYAGGSKTNSVYYYNNTIRDTVFQGRYSGGTGGIDNEYGDESAGTTYENNTIENVIFSGKYAGGSLYGYTNYTENSIEDVIYSGQSAGGSEQNQVIYLSNSLTNVSFSGRNAGGSRWSSILYESNFFGEDLEFPGIYSGESEYAETVYTENYGSLRNRHDYTLSTHTINTNPESWYDHPPYTRSDFGGIGAIVLSFFLISVTGTLFSLALWFVRKDQTL